MAELQPALARHHYVSPSSWRRRARAGAAVRWTCVGRLDELGLSRRARDACRTGAPSPTCSASPSLVTTDGDGGVARVRERLPAPRLAGGAGRPGWPRARRLRRKVAALPVPLLDVRPGRPAAARAAHRRTSTTSTGRSSALHRSSADAWGGFLWRQRPTPAPRRCADSLRSGAASGSARYPLDTLVVGRRFDLRGRGQLEGARRELQRVLPLRPGAPGAVPARAGVRRRRRGPGRGRTASRTARAPGRSPCPARSTAAPFPDLDDAERVRHKGELRLPEPAAVAVGRARRGVRAAAARRRPHRDRLRPAVRAGRGGPAGLRPVRRRRALGPGQPAGLGDLRVGAARHVVALLHAGGTRRWRTLSLDIRRWLLPRLGSCWTESTHEHRRHTTSSSSGLGALGSSTAWHAARRGLVACWASSSSSSATTAARRTTPRGSSGTATTPPPTSRLTFAAYDDWADLEARDRRAVRHGDRWGRPVPARRRDPDGRLHRRRWTPAACLRGARRRRGRRAVAAVRTCPTGTDALYQARTGIVPAARGTAAMQRQAPRHGAGCATTPASRRSCPAPTASTSSRPTAVSARARRRHRRRVDRAAARTARRRPAADRDRGAGHLLRARRPAAVRPERLPGVDLDGRPVLLRVPDLRRGDRQGRAGLRRARR